MSKRRVVISGLGCVTSLGESANEMFNAVCEGKSGISSIEAFDPSDYPVKFGGEVKEEEIIFRLNRKPELTVGIGVDI